MPVAGWLGTGRRGEGVLWGSATVHEEACWCWVCMEQQWHPVLRQLMWRAWNSNITSLLGKWTNIMTREMWLRWVSSLRAADNGGKWCSRSERTFTGHILAESSVASVCFISSLTTEKSGSALGPSAPSQFISGHPLFSFISEIVAGPLTSEYSVSLSLSAH